MKQIIIKGGTIVTPDKIFKGDIVIEGKFIKRITEKDSVTSLKSENAFQANICKEDNTVINAEGLHIFPGVIDDQVHFREPGATQKATIYSESRAAILGGVTSFMDMPNNNPTTTTLEALENKFEIARRDSYANYSFYLGATNTNLNEIKNIDKRRVCGIKVFMGSSTGNMLVDSEEMLNSIFRESPTTVATHCEDEETIRKNLEAYKQKYMKPGQDADQAEIPFSAHPNIRSRQACIKSSEKAIELAKKYNTQLHILHISTADEIEMIKKAHEEGYNNITGEICVHYLNFCREDYDKYGSRVKCNPAIKEKTDMLALRQAIKDGVINVVATDHAPHLLKEKENTYLKAPSGLPLVQHSFQLMLELAKQDVFDLNVIPKVMSQGPAQRFGIKQRGELKEGYFADIVIADLNCPDTTSTISPAYKCGWSPLKDRKLGSSIKYTILNGEIAAKDGEITETKSAMELEF